MKSLDFAVRLTAFVIFAAAVFLYGWNSDDAYHSYIMAKHLVDGKGLVYNTGFRVSASTCPLLTLIEAFVFLFTDNVDVCGLMLGFAFSAMAAWILFFRISQSSVVSLCASCLMVASGCFLSFTTSGLENPMLFFFGAVFFNVYFRNSDLSRGCLFVISLLMSLVAMTRTDAVLIFAPMAVWAYLARTKAPWHMRVLIGIAGLSPFIAWTCFSIVYYGFPFPNTYYAKLHAGIPVAEYMIRGLKYYPASWLVDPMMLLVPAFAIGIAIKKWSASLVPLFIGLTVYCLYVVSIGGDFMAGRHLTQQYFLLLCSCAMLLGGSGCSAEHSVLSRDRWFLRMVFPICIGIVLLGVAWNYCVGPKGTAWPLTTDVVNERHFYFSYGGEIPLFRSVWRSVKRGGDHAVKHRDAYRERRIVNAHEKGERGLCFGSEMDDVRNSGYGVPVLFGKDIFAAMDLDMYLTDVIALQDPLMARLKVSSPGNWRVGHIMREVPRGYNETLALGENKIEDPSLHEYYDKLLLVMKGPLFDRERLWTIFGFNLGRYDKLLERADDAPRSESRNWERK